MQVSDLNSIVQAPIFYGDQVESNDANITFFSIAALLKYRGLKSELIPFIGNVYTGLKSRIIGNKVSVSNVDLIRSIESLLK
jgi:hypothetical protein